MESVHKYGDNPAFMAEFTKAIEAYSQAASAGQTEQAEAAAFEALCLASEEAERNPSPELLLAEQARACEDRGGWAEAETIYRKILALAEVSNEATRSKYGRIHKTQLDLGGLFPLRGDFAKAQECAAAATADARLTELSPVLTSALERDAYCALRLNDLPGALAAATEAVRIVEPGALSDSLRARAWVARACCHVAAGNYDLAEQDLVSSQPQFFENPIPDLYAGVHSGAAGWWEVRANLFERRGNWPAASEAWTRAVECRRHVASLPHVQGPHTLAALARTLLRLGPAMWEAGEVKAAERGLAEGSNIWRELGLAAQAAL